MSESLDSGRMLECRKYTDGSVELITDLVSEEIPVTILVDGQVAARLWAHPHDLEELVSGHAMTSLCPSGTEPQISSRDGFSFVLSFIPAKNRNEQFSSLEYDSDCLMEAMRGFIKASGYWNGTGCFHRAAVFDPRERKILHRAEDIGRHNCLDRLAGWALSSNTDLGSHILLVSARITASLYEKARACGFKFMVSRSAVTTSSVSLAKEHGVTLVGFARENENRFTIFADVANRIG